MKLQNNFTTPEQSKRLLELGLPADSADLRYTRIKGNQNWHKPYLLTTRCKFHGARCMEALPCWSVGRLMEIYDNCLVEPINGMWADYTDRTDYVKYIIACYNSSKFDFSKLED